MRIVQFVTQVRGGPVDHTVDVACELADRGNEVHVIGPAGLPAKRLADAGVTLHELAITHKADVRGLRALAALLRTLVPEVVHCQDMRAGLVGRLAAGLARVPVRVYTVHGVPDAFAHLVRGNATVQRPRHRDRLTYVAGERLLARLVPARIVVPCTAVGRYVTDHLGIAPARVYVVHNGVDTERFGPRRHAAGTDLTAVWLGVMAPVKRLPVLLEATASVPGLRLRLVGDGPERESVRARVEALGIADRVELSEHTDDPARLLADADVFVLPSAAEACPLALLQALATGLACVATSVGGVPEVVRDGIDGLLVRPDDSAQLAAAMREIVEDDGRRAALRIAARERAVSAFGLARCVDGLVDVYRGAA